MGWLRDNLPDPKKVIGWITLMGMLLGGFAWGLDTRYMTTEAYAQDHEATQAKLTVMEEKVDLGLLQSASVACVIVKGGKPFANECIIEIKDVNGNLIQRMSEPLVPEKKDK